MSYKQDMNSAANNSNREGAKVAPQQITARNGQRGSVMLSQPTRIAWSKPERITRLGMNHNKMARMAVFAQVSAPPFVAKEIQCPETGGWVRQPGGESCEVLVAAIMAASNARIHDLVEAQGVTVARVKA